MHCPKTFEVATRDIVTIGASAGGVRALARVASALPADYAGAICVVVHTLPDVRSRLAEILSHAGPLPAVIAADRMPLQHGRIHVAAPDRHLLIEREQLRVVCWQAENHHRPAIGGRIGYSLATGLCIGLVCFLGLVALLLAVIPLVAVLPILLYIGIVITSQAFEATPRAHYPAVVLALIPNIAAWTQNQVDGALTAAGTSAGQLGMAKLGDAGVVYHGMALLGGGAILAGMVLAAIAAFIIDHNFKKAAVYAVAGAALSFIGFIHGEKLGFGQGDAPQIALGYLLLAAICYGLALRGAETPAPAEAEEAEPVLAVEGAAPSAGSG